MPEKILIIRLSSLGDVILTIPVLRSIKAHWPDCSISILVKKQYAPVLEGNPYLDEIILFESLWESLRHIREKKFTRLLDLHGNLRSFFIRWLSGIRNVSRYRKHALARRLFVLFRRRWPEMEKQTVDLYLEALRAWKIPALAEPAKLEADPSAVSVMAKELELQGIKSSDIVVGIHPGAKWRTKRWLAERFAQLCQRFEAQAIKVILTGEKEDEDLCAFIAQKSRGINFAGKTDLGQLMTLMSRFSLFITNDSGPMHLATAYGVPTLALFGPTSKELGFFPQGLGNRVVEADLACRPCSLHGGDSCPHGHFLCMKLITTDEVWENALATMMGKAKQS